MTIVVVNDDCMTGDGCSMVEDVDDNIACDQHYCAEKLEHQPYDQEVGGKGCLVLDKKPTDQVTG